MLKFLKLKLFSPIEGKQNVNSFIEGRKIIKNGQLEEVKLHLPVFQFDENFNI